MRLITILLLMLPVLTFGQRYHIGRIDSIAVTDLSTIHTFKVGGVRYVENGSASVKVFEMDTFNFVDNLLIDKTDSANNFELKNSYGLEISGSEFASLNKTFYFNVADSFYMEFYAAKYSVNNGLVIGGTTTSNYIVLFDASLKIQTTSQQITLSNSGTPADSVIRHYIVYSKNDSINVFMDGTLVDKVLNTFTDSVGCKFLFSRGTTYTFHGKIFGLYMSDKNETHYWPMAEGYDNYIYDVIDTIHGSGSYSTFNYITQDVFHYNLQHGYTLYSDSAHYKNVPYKLNGTANMVVVPGYVKVSDNPAGDWHNGAETGIQAPLSLFPYDYNNYLFDAGDLPNILYYENFSENVGDRIFMNVSTPYQYKNLLIYNKQLE